MTAQTARAAHTATDPDNYTGYRTFRIGGFGFRRDEYFAHISWPDGDHLMPVDGFLRALVRVVAWNFFYGTLNFDDVFGTTNLYGRVELYIGRFNDAYRENGRDYRETIDSDDLRAAFQAMLEDWTNQGYDPFAAPQETAQPFGRKNGRNSDALGRVRVMAKRMVGMPGDAPLRTDESGYPVNRMFADVAQDEPRGRGRARLRERGAVLQPLRLSLALGRDLEPVCLHRAAGQPVLPDLGGVLAPGGARQRPRRVVHPALGRDHLEREGQGLGRPPRSRDHAGG